MLSAVDRHISRQTDRVYILQFSELVTLRIWPVLFGDTFTQVLKSMTHQPSCRRRRCRQNAPTDDGAHGVAPAVRRRRAEPPFGGKRHATEVRSSSEETQDGALLRQGKGTGQKYAPSGRRRRTEIPSSRHRTEPRSSTKNAERQTA